VKLTIDNVSTTVETDEDELGWLREYLTYEVPGYDPRSRKRYVERYCSLSRERFPSGLVEMVEVAAAEDEGFYVERVDKRNRPTDEFREDRLGWLYDYQLKGVRAAHRSTRGILSLATGSGKTEIGIGLSLAIPVKWLFLVDSKDLMYQTAARYHNRTGLVAGTIGDGRWGEYPGHGVSGLNCATFQTLYRHLDDERTQRLLASTGGLIVDEAHTLPASTFWRVSQACGAYWRLGLSATPLDREDRRSILTVAALGPIIYRVPPQDLIAAGAVARPRITMVPYQHPRPTPGSRRKWDKVYRDGVSRNAHRNRFTASVVVRAAKPSLVFVKHTKHLFSLQAALQQEGLVTEVAHGKHSSWKRRETMEAANRGDVDAVVCTVVFQKGIDIPELRSVVNAAAGRSAIASLQRLGRGMRNTPSKDEFELWDIADEGDPMLEKHSRTREKTYRDEGYEVRRA